MPQPAAIESGDRSHTLPQVESVAQISTMLQDTDPTLDPALAAVARTAAGEGVVLLRNEGVLPLPGRCRRQCRGVRPRAARLVRRRLRLGRRRQSALHLEPARGARRRRRPGRRRPRDHLPRLDLREPPESRRHVGQLAAPLRRDAPRARRRGGRRGPRRCGRRRRRPRRGRGAREHPRTGQLLPHRRRAGHARRRHGSLRPRRRGDSMPATSWTSAWLADYGDRIGAVLYAWQGGMEGARAVAGVLAGEIPERQTHRHHRRDYADYPSSDNFGDPDVGVYAEDVFVGYRYFETFAPERVLFPFGFGLSDYTSFAVKILEAEVDAGTFRATVEVRNTGGHPRGQEVVQLYVGAPDGLLSQPVKRLAAFGKTGPLAPGESEPSPSARPRRLRVVRRLGRHRAPQRLRARGRARTPSSSAPTCASRPRSPRSWSPSFRSSVRSPRPPPPRRAHRFAA